VCHHRTHRGQAHRPHPHGRTAAATGSGTAVEHLSTADGHRPPGGLGKIDKFRQDRHYLQPSWQDAYRPARANIEGLNGRAKSHGVNIADPARRLAHGRVAQTILLALMILTINLGILHSWTQTSTPAADAELSEENTGGNEQRPPVTSASGIPPPADARTTEMTRRPCTTIQTPA
jgi:hypothetical protein